MAFTWSKKHKQAFVCGRTPNGPLYLLRRSQDELKAVSSLSPESMALCVGDADLVRNYRWVDYDPLRFDPKKGVLLGAGHNSPIYLARIRRKTSGDTKYVTIVPGCFILLEGVAVTSMGWNDKAVESRFQVLLDCSGGVSASASAPPSYSE